MGKKLYNVKTVIIENDGGIFAKNGQDSLSNYNEYSLACFNKEANPSMFPLETIAEESMLFDFYLRKLTCICYLPENIDRDKLEIIKFYPELEHFKYIVVTPNIQNVKVGGHEAAEILNYDNFLKTVDALIEKKEKLEKKEKTKEKKLKFAELYDMV